MATSVWVASEMGLISTPLDFHLKLVGTPQPLDPASEPELEPEDEPELEPEPAGDREREPAWELAPGLAFEPDPEPEPEQEPELDAEAAPELAPIPPSPQGNGVERLEPPPAKRDPDTTTAKNNRIF